MILYSDGEPSGGGCFEDMKLSFKIDKDKKQIILDVYEKYEWIDDPHDPHHYKLKGLDDKSKVKEVTYSEESMLPVSAIIDINDCYCTKSEDYYCLVFNNKADWDKRRRREITDIYIPIKEVKYSTYFRKLIQLLEGITKVI